jgi:hypothetical protein
MIASSSFASAIWQSARTAAMPAALSSAAAINTLAERISALAPFIIRGSFYALVTS